MQSGSTKYVGDKCEKFCQTQTLLLFIPIIFMILKNHSCTNLACKDSQKLNLCVLYQSDIAY
jgi:hypothetical protein